MVYIRVLWLSFCGFALAVLHINFSITSLALRKSHAFIPVPVKGLWMAWIIIPYWLLSSSAMVWGKCISNTGSLGHTHQFRQWEESKSRPWLIVSLNLKTYFKAFVDTVPRSSSGCGGTRNSHLRSISVCWRHSARRFSTSSERSLT